MTAPTTHLNCTQCGAGLDVLGGGRVQTHVCPYCGAELDAQDDYRVIAQFRDMRRPETPFDLGQKGMLWGIEFTVIGTMEWTEYHGGRSWTWVDHQVYSPTHGYAWLTVENGWVTFTRKTREASNPPYVSDRLIETSENRPAVQHDGQRFHYYSSGRAKPTFIEGEFNFRPSLDDTIDYVNLLGPDSFLDIVSGGTEREYELSYLPDQGELMDSFGVPKSRRPRPRGVHPLQVLDRTPLQYFVRNLALAAAALSIVLALMVALQGTSIATSGRVNASRDIDLPFTVTDGGRLTEITIWADASNSWAWFEAELTDGEDEPVAEFERGVEYYHGSDWSEGSQKSKTRLRLDPGDYTLSLRMTEADVDWSGGRRATAIEASVKQGVANPWWLWGTALVFGLIGGSFLAQRGFHRNRRWAGSDWDDD